MIDFAFSAEQEDFRKELRRFAVTELAPRYRERAARSEFCWTAHGQPHTDLAAMCKWWPPQVAKKATQ